MRAFREVTSSVVVLPIDDVDTDQIIPARFLKGTDKNGLGASLFADWRGQPDFALERPSARGAEILVTGANFGCGSSREHAPWALVDWGFRAIIAPSFADIFRENATKNGLLTVALSADACAAIADAVRGDSKARVSVDLQTERVRIEGRPSSFAFSTDAFARRCLLEGLDELGYLLSFADRIAAHEEAT